MYCARCWPCAGLKPVKACRRCVFSELLAGSELEPALRNEIDELLVRKQRAGEAEYGIRRPLLHAFIQHELARGEVAPELPDSRTGRVEQLDRLLMSTVLAP